MRCLTVISALVALTVSCSKPEAKPEAVARAGEAYLYRSDLEGLVPAGTPKKDSLAIVSSFIDRWAAGKLLMEAAEMNLGKEQKAGFNELIKQYKVDLYTKAYLEQMVQRSVDTVVEEAELERYYAANRQNFRATGTLVKLRYINIPKDHPKFGQIRAKFLDFRKEDRKFWDTYQPQFASSALNDSVWVEMNEIYRRLPFITPDNRESYIADGISYEKPEGNSTYLVKVRDVVERNEVAPYAYLRPTLKELILNRRKLDQVKKIEKEITDDAIKNDKYEIYKRP